VMRGNNSNKNNSNSNSSRNCLPRHRRSLHFFFSFALPGSSRHLAPLGY
ncbi:hypothetical protein AWZ03_014517, partial [Drosophila navojoa]